MNFKRTLRDSLKNKIPKNKLCFLPSGFQRVGHVVILDLKPEIVRYKKMIADIILKKYPYIKTVCRKIGGVKGEKREPGIEIISGNGSETIHRENGCLYKIDVCKLMFAKGNTRERGRVADIVMSGETIVDMFAGLGYFSIPIAKRNPKSFVYSIDINPVAISYLKENCRLNGIKNIKIIKKDCKKVGLKGTADRIIMGYLPGTERFLSKAFLFLKDSGIIHYHNIYRKEELWKRPIRVLEDRAKKSGYRLNKVIYKKVVKQYSPGVYHVVLDVHFKKQSCVSSCKRGFFKHQKTDFS